ncbi:MAG: translation initiation factor IF-2 [Planctomycetaceae bacterium]|nr:translation initiation factor IF-2 [Planctomycetaceae bacterium]
MKIRIFALAKELGMDSKVLIKRCNDAGIQVKSSALASISPEERDIVVAFLKNEDSGDSDDEQSPMTPTREPTRDVSSKMRTIKDMAPRPQHSRPAAQPVEEPPEEAPAATVVAEAPEVVADPVSAPPTEAPAVDPGSVEAPPQPSSVESPPVDTPPAEVAAENVETPPTEGEDDDKVVPISRDDYVSTSGFSSTIREMKPRGTSDQGRGRSKAKSKPALPAFAAPPKPVKAKQTKPKAEPVQKPDMPLSPAELNSPLAEHLKKHSEKKHKKKKSLLDDSDGMIVGRGNLGLVENRKERREKRQRARREADDEARIDKRSRRSKKRSGPVELKTEAEIELPITVRSLSEAIGRPAKSIIAILFQNGDMARANINANLEEEEAIEFAMELGVDLTIKRGRDVEDELQAMLDLEEPEEFLSERPPIVTILGHVDHGKTSLLDKIRSAAVADGEAGGITQHIASYQAECNGKKITFVDTPGHAAFGEMRARGANVTDIIILVVAADDGVMPQTVECISHAKASGAPIIVAMNKIDLPDVNEQKVLGDLASHEIMPQEWGGDVEVVRTSAETGQGLDELLEHILLMAELHEFKANAEGPSLGVCLEAFRDEGRGVLSWLMVQRGSLKVGDVVLCGPAYGKVRAMYNDRDEMLTEVGPSTPVMVSGFDSVPQPGDHFFPFDELDDARATAENRRQVGRAAFLSTRGRPRTMEDILNAAKGGVSQDLPLILKADTPGSIEALKSELNKFDHPEVSVTILHEGVGGVNESDVYLASASQAIIIAFHVIAEDRAVQLADREGIDIRRYNIIYEVTDQIKRVLEGLLEPEKVQVPTGRALVLQTFHISRFGTIAGCRVLSGTIERSNRVHVIRDQKVLNDYSLASLKREKDDAKEVREGMECGIRIDGFNDVKEGDLLEAFRIDTKKRTLEDRAE